MNLRDMTLAAIGRLLEAADPGCLDRSDRELDDLAAALAGDTPAGELPEAGAR